eukprot:4871019-Pyramimonas_sp.AAC.1
MTGEGRGGTEQSRRACGLIYFLDLRTHSSSLKDIARGSAQLHSPNCGAKGRESMLPRAPQGACILNACNACGASGVGADRRGWGAMLGGST